MMLNGGAGEADLTLSIVKSLGSELRAGLKPQLYQLHDTGNLLILVFFHFHISKKGIK